MNAPPPAHAEEHHALMQLIGKVVDQSSLIGGMIIITIGVDGRPCVGANIDDPAIIAAILRTLGEAEHGITGITRIRKPTSN